MVPRWVRTSPHALRVQHPELYDSPDQSTRRLIEDLATFPETEDDGETERRVYTPDGVEVPRRTPRGLTARHRGAMLQNLATVHRLFDAPDDGYDSDMDSDIFELDDDQASRIRSRQPDVSYTSYPHMFSKTYGQWQANGIIRPMVPHIQQLSNTLTEPGSGGQAITALNSQCYNNMSHRMRVSKRHHLAQRGVLTGAAAGPWATTTTARTTALALFGEADIALPHERMTNQLAMGAKTELRLENNFLLDFTHLKDEYRTGDALYRNFVLKYGRICSRGDVIDPLRQTCVVFRDEVRSVCYSFLVHVLTCSTSDVYTFVRVVRVPHHHRYGPHVEGPSSPLPEAQRSGSPSPRGYRCFSFVSGYRCCEQLAIIILAVWSYRGGVIRPPTESHLRRRHQSS